MSSVMDFSGFLLMSIAQNNTEQAFPVRSVTSVLIIKILMDVSSSQLWILSTDQVYRLFF